MKSFKQFLLESEEIPNPLYTGEKPHQAHLDSGWIFHKNAKHHTSEQHLDISTLKSDQKHLSTGLKKDSLFSREPDIFVMKSGGEHHIIDGNHRIAKAKSLGEKTIRATVVDMDAFNRVRREAK